MAKIVGFANLDKKTTNDEWRSTNAAFRLALRGLVDHLTEENGKPHHEVKALYDTRRQASKFRRGTGAVYKHWKESRSS